jgi:hypothetical protein
MFVVNDQYQIVVGLGLASLAVAAFWRLIVWVRDAPVKPDPWGEAVQKQLEEAPEICPHCSTPQLSSAWFCPRCGCAVGPVNMMPFIFEGEVLRNCGAQHFKHRPIISVGYTLLGFSFIPFFLIPIYWVSLFQRWWRPDDSESTKP